MLILPRRRPPQSFIQRLAARLARWLRRSSAQDTRVGPRLEPVYYLQETQLQALRELAQIEGRSEDEVASELIAAGLAQRQYEQEILVCWERLTPREREVTVLLCRGFTSQEIAEALVIGGETVKSHLRSAVSKFGLHGRGELRLLLTNWNFGELETWAAEMRRR